MVSMSSTPRHPAHSASTLITPLHTFLKVPMLPQPQRPKPYSIREKVKRCKEHSSIIERVKDVFWRRLKGDKVTNLYTLIRDL